MRSIGRDHPIFVERAEGFELIDADGHRYVDWVCSWGPLILGHAPEAVIAAAEEISLEQIETPAAALIFNRCCELSRGGITPTFDRLLLEFDEPAIKNLLVDLDEQGRAKSMDDAGNLKESAEPAARMRDLLGRITFQKGPGYFLDAAEQIQIRQFRLEDPNDRIERNPRNHNFVRIRHAPRSPK